jgi:hypothetical protein
MVNHKGVVIALEKELEQVKQHQQKDVEAGIKCEED